MDWGWACCRPWESGSWIRRHRQQLPARRRSGCADRRLQSPPAPRRTAGSRWRREFPPASPARSAAMRARFQPCSPSGCAQPMITSSISALLRLGTRSKAPLNAIAARSSGRVVESAPLGARPTGVRTAATRTASGMDGSKHSERQTAKNTQRHCWLIVRWPDASRSSCSAVNPLYRRPSRRLVRTRDKSFAGR